MKLYYSPNACSLSPHIALREAGLPFELVLASTKTHQLADGTDYYTINPKGYVPLLELDNGERLTEGPAIVQWIADQVPDKRLAPPAGTMPRYRNSRISRDSCNG
jgi:glutathione S-transferase